MVSINDMVKGRNGACWMTSMPIELTAPVEGHKFGANETEERKKTNHWQQQSKSHWKLCLNELRHGLRISKSLA